MDLFQKIFGLKSGLYGETGKPEIYYITNGDLETKRHITSSEALVSEFGADAWGKVTWLPAGGFQTEKNKVLFLTVATLSVLALAVLFLMRRG